MYVFQISLHPIPILIKIVSDEEARALGLPTIGFACREAKTQTTFDCDEVHLAGNNFGDETPAFLQFCDGLVRVGGTVPELKQYNDFQGPKWQFDLAHDTVSSRDVSDKSATADAAKDR